MSNAIWLLQRQNVFLGTIANQISVPSLDEFELLGLLARTRPERRDEMIAAAHIRYNGKGGAIVEHQESVFDKTPFNERWRYCDVMKMADPSVDIVQTMNGLDADDLAAFAADSECVVRDVAFQAFLLKIRPFVFRVMNSKMHVQGEESQDEIARRVAFRLYCAFWSGKYQVDGHVFGFIRETTRQEALGYFKEDHRRNKVEVQHVESSTLEAIGVRDFDPVSSQAVDAEAVRAVLQTIDQKKRIFLLMIEIEGHSIKEVAIRLGWSEDTVRRRHAAALEEFRGRWISRFGDDR